MRQREERGGKGGAGGKPRLGICSINAWKWATLKVAQTFYTRAEFTLASAACPTGAAFTFASAACPTRAAFTFASAA
jgi:hypothetical protein